MSIGLVFWIIFLLWFLFGLYAGRGDLAAGNYHPFGVNLILAILIFLLGWGQFGFIVRG